MSIVPQDSEEPCITGGAFDDVKDTVSPFGYQRCEGVDLGAGDPEWIVTKERSKWDLVSTLLKLLFCGEITLWRGMST
jgi:EH domain-containing protein 1